MISRKPHSTRMTAHMPSVSVLIFVPSPRRESVDQVELKDPTS